MVGIFLAAKLNGLTFLRASNAKYDDAYYFRYVSFEQEYEPGRLQACLVSRQYRQARPEAYRESQLVDIY
jgi:hypothetical protein